MSITSATTRADFSGFLTREQSQPIFERAARISVAQRLARQVPLGTEGKAIPVVTGKMTAGWVAEGAEKPKSHGTMALKNMDPRKLAAIAVVSAEVVRANPGGYMQAIRTQVAEAFALAFDAAGFHGINSPFATHIAQTTKSVELGTASQAAGGVHADIVAGLHLLVEDGKKLRGFGLDDRFEPLLLGSVDTTGRPIYIDTPLDETTAAMFTANDAQPARPGRLIGRPSWMSEGIAANDILGFAGDWTQAAWGVASGIRYDISREASVTINGELVSLWEHNLVAVLAEAEYGWLVNDPESFVAYTYGAGEGEGEGEGED